MSVVVQIESNGRINPNDVIVFKNGKWVNVTKGEFLANTFEYVDKTKNEFLDEISKLKQEITELKNELSQNNKDLIEYKAKINEKLKEHHNVLNALSK